MTLCHIVDKLTWREIMTLACNVLVNWLDHLFKWLKRWRGIKWRDISVSCHGHRQKYSGGWYLYVYKPSLLVYLFPEIVSIIKPGWPRLVAGWLLLILRLTECGSAESWELELTHLHFSVQLGLSRSEDIQHMRALPYSTHTAPWSQLSY